ncbi:hypothetical protein ACFOHS_18730 [Jhaorihella thermophila]
MTSSTQCPASRPAPRRSTRRRRPIAIARAEFFARLRNYVDRIERFEEGRSGDFRIRPGQIEARRLELAVPFGTTPEQAIQIQRAIDYASEWGIEVNVRFVQ